MSLKPSITSSRNGPPAAEHILLESEREQAFAKLLHEYDDFFQPRDLVEQNTVLEMVGARWRTRRLWAIKNNMLNQQARKQALGEPCASNAETFDTLKRYEAHLRREHRRAKQAFVLLRGKFGHKTGE